MKSGRRVLQGWALLLSAPLCAQFAMAVTVAGISPTVARLDAAQTFVITGAGLAVNRVSIEGCIRVGSGDVLVEPGVIQHTCLPVSVGGQRVLLDGADAGLAKLLFAHPARTGNPASRGVPSVAGVSLFNGNYHLQVVDMSVPTKGMPFVLSRSYNSYDWGSESNRGAVEKKKPWRFNWDVKAGYVPTTNNQQIFVQLADGGSHSYRLIEGTWVPMDAGNFNHLTVGANSISVTTRAGVTQVFELPGALGGRLRQVADVHGQAFVLSYGTHGKVSSVRDPNGRSFTFSYEGGRLVKVTDYTVRTNPGGRSVQYTWECGDVGGTCGATTNERERLLTVTEARSAADNLAAPPVPVRTTRYTYGTYLPPVSAANPSILLNRITDPSGKPVVQLTHAFAAYGNWGVTSLADGVNNTWRFAYCADVSTLETSAPDCKADPVFARRFRTTATPPQGAPQLAFFDAAGRHTGSVDGRGRRSAVAQPDILPLNDSTYNRAGLTQERKSPLALQGGWGTQFVYETDIPARAGLMKRLRQFVNGSPIETVTEWFTGAAQANLFCPEASVSAEGLRRTTARDDRCRPIAQAEPGRTASTLTYAKPGMPARVSAVRNPLQGDTLLDYDAFGNPIRTVGPMGETTSSIYDDIGRLTRQTNELLGETITTYEGGSNRVRTITDALNRITRFEYDTSGNLARRTASNGQVTTYTYDNANRLTVTSTTVSTPAGPQVVSTRNVYDALGRVVQTINARNNPSTTTFDDAGQVLARSNALSQATQYEYDDDGRVTKVTDPAGRVVDTRYDELGRVTSVTTPAGSQSYEYDKDGRVVRHMDARNNVTRYRYHPTKGHLVEVTDARNEITTAEYDEAGNVVAISDPKRNTTRFEFDKSNRRTKRTDPNGHIWTWEYDAAGNVRFARAPGGLVTEYVYDKVSQLKEVRLPNSTPIAYDYDVNGNRTSMSDSTGVTRYAYDGINRLVQVTDPQAKVLKYAYDPAGNRTAITYPNNKVVGYAFDRAERLVSVSDWLGKTHTYTLNAAGQVTQLALGNGTKATMVYDAASRLQSLVNSGPGNAVISSHTLQMDPEGNITEAAVQLPLLPSFGSSTKTMAYDDANRLKSVDGAAVVHDDAGRLTAIGGEGYAYDARDLLTTITGPNAATYTYNGAGHRVAKTSGSATTRYVIDPNAPLFNVVAENDGTNALLRSYIHGYGLLMQISAADVPRYYHYDPTGHTLALTDAGGVVTDRYAYTPYGETTASGTSVNPFRFAGKFGVMDEGTGKYFMRARYFSGTANRFLSLDSREGSVESNEDLNRYQYALSNPVSLHDASGNAPQKVGAKDQTSPSSISVRISIHSSTSRQLICYWCDRHGDQLRISDATISQHGKSYGAWQAEGFADGQVHHYSWPNLSCAAMKYRITAISSDDGKTYVSEGDIKPSKRECDAITKADKPAIFRRVNVFNWGTYFFGDDEESEIESTTGVRG